MDGIFRVEEVRIPDETVLNGLAEITFDVVNKGASVGFLLPFTFDQALRFWRKVKPRVENENVTLLIAKESVSGRIAGTVQLIKDLPENQPHRADVAKMQVHSDFRRKGVGEMLLKAIEKEAFQQGRTLLVLDTATGSEGERLYARSGWTKVGTIPEYALWPDGTLCASTFFYKKLN